MTKIVRARGFRPEGSVSMSMVGKVRVSAVYAVEETTGFLPLLSSMPPPSKGWLYQQFPHATPVKVFVNEAIEQTASSLMEGTAMSDTLRARPTCTAVSHLDPTLLHQTVLVKNSDVQTTSMDGETVLLDLSTGRYYTLNQVGSLIWEHCTGKQTISDIHAVLCNRFDVVPERALEDLTTLVNQLTQEGVLQQERR